MPALAPLRVIGPPPVQPPYGLTNTPGTIVSLDDLHFLGGVGVDSYPTEVPLTHDPCSSGSARIKAIGEKPPAPEFGSFTVYIPITCGGKGVGTEVGAQLLRNRALQAFEARESYGVELELALAPADPTRPHLTGAGPWDNAGAGLVTLGSGAVGPREALALLEQAIGETAQNGYIHIDPATGVMWFSYGLLEPVGAELKTKRGNTVIIGNGYIGAQPDEEEGDLADDHSWAFATGLVRVARDGATVIGNTMQSIDYSTNEITFRAERNYVAYWDTALQVGVEVDRSQTP